MWATSDQGRTWRSWQFPDAGAVTSVFVDPADSRTALVSLEAGRSAGAARVARTLNGGIFWDDLTADLPAKAAQGVAADRATGAVYLATDAGLYFTYADLRAPGPATSWMALSRGLPVAAAMDVRLDDAGNQIYVALDGFGVFAAAAPHRRRDPRLVSAADYSARAAAPGTLLSVLGSQVESARSGNLTVPVLDANAMESQIQVPFDATGSTLMLALATRDPNGRLSLGLPLQPTSPAIFVDRDGTPMVLDADSGAMLDGMKTARSGTRVQILATGLGRVRPDWPAGLPAPLENAPRVVAAVRVYLDRVPLEVTRATLAPGYVGFYLIEFLVPDIVNSGPAELLIEAGGVGSNRVSLVLEP